MKSFRQRSSQAGWFALLSVLSACSHADELNELRDRRNRPSPAVQSDTGTSEPVMPDSGMPLMPDSGMVEPAPTCTVTIQQPTPAQPLGLAEDVDPNQPDVQIVLSVSVANCASTPLHYGLCLPSEQGPIAPAAWLGELPRATTTAHVRLTLPTNPGLQLLCVQSDRLQTVSIERVCNGGEVACGAPPVCRTDTLSNPLACGASCQACAGGLNGAPACVDGFCEVACDPGYRSAAGRCRARPSCKGQETACQGKDCCAEALIEAEAGQELRFVRGYDASQNSTGLAYFQPKTAAPVVLRPFYLDQYEVTVGRFRSFVEGFESWRHSGNPKSAHGSHPSDPASGWQDNWNFERLTLVDGQNVSLVPESRAELVARLTAAQCAPHFTWTDKPADHELLPINCVDFFLAYMFCIWDSDSSNSRLPTEAEWHAAASGGGQQRAYPWSSPDFGSLEIAGHAVFDQGERPPFPVGGSEAGVGRWGSFDLGGNVLEWVRDTAPSTGSSNPYIADPDDPIQLSNDADVLEDRVLRGGSFKHSGCVQCSGASELRTVARRLIRPHEAYNDVGFRCARSYQ